MELMKELRFVIKDDAANTRQVILDRTNPEKSDWYLFTRLEGLTML
jgi:hypothetical protein